MGVPNYVPDAGKIWGSSYSMDQGKSGLPNANWDQDQKNKAALSDKADRLVNAGILGRPTPAFTDTSAYAQQVAAARANQLASLDNLRKSAMGQGPSYANAQSAIGLGQGINQMHAPQGNALAQRNQMLAGNAALGQVAGQGGLARGTEMGNALNAYGTGSTGLRGGDLAGQQAAAQQLGRYQALGLQGAKGNQGLVQGLEGLAMDSNLAKTKAAQDWYDYWIKEQGAQANNNAQSVGAGAAAFATIASMMAAAAA